MAQIDYFFQPSSVAVVGASAKEGRIGYEILKSLVDSGFGGRIFPIHLNEEEILGLKAYRKIGEVPFDVDLAVMALPAEKTPSLVEECGEKGVKAIVIVSGGFRELGGKGAYYESELMGIAGKYGIRIIGPNCVGIFNSRNNLDTFFQPRYAMMRPPAGNIAILTQSGTYGVTLLEWLAEEKVGASKFVSYGNKVDVDEVAMLEYLLEDEDTRVIAIYNEGLEDGRAFLRTARRVAERKPIVIFKAGKTAKGAEAAKSHTGALAGSAEVFKGAMRQCGVIVADSLEEVFDISKILALQPDFPGNRAGMVTNGAGPCIVAVDAMENTRLEMARLSSHTIESLRKKLPPFCVFSNPLDVTGSADFDMYRISIEALLGDPKVDIIIPYFVFQDGPIANTADATVSYLTGLEASKPIICVAGGGLFTKEKQKQLQAGGVPVIPTSTRMVSALDKVLWYHQWLRRKRAML